MARFLQKTRFSQVLVSPRQGFALLVVAHHAEIRDVLFR
jgi:hypothetical protein